MKTTILYGLLLFSMVASLCGCTADELPDSSEASGDVESFSITVADAGGYASVSGGTPTRATENGYTTTFVEGDQIGVFAVKNNALMPGVNNLRLTAKNDGERLVWLDDYGKSPLRYTGATYYAYYPYRDGIEGTHNNTNQDANSFFANVIKGWTPSTNQSSSTAYSAQDLMIAANQPTDKQLSFSMSHCMALVVLDLPRKKYTFTNAPTSPPYIIDASGTRFNSFIPYRMSDGTYRYLVKPTAAAKTLLSGSYTNAGNEVAEWTIDAKAIAAGTYKVFTVDRIGIEEFSHDLQIGDFYMKDGSLVGKGESLSLEQQKACIGIVYCTDINRIGDAAKKVLKDKGVAAPHGLVMALTNASNQCQWGNIDVDENGNAGTGTFQNYTNTLKKQYNNVDGYAETHWILDTYGSNVNALQNMYSAFYHASRYGTEGNTLKYAAPANTTGWFIPSMGQWWDILSNLGGIDLKDYQESVDNLLIIHGTTQTANNMNRYLEKINGATKFSIGSFFWSSSEYSILHACLVDFYRATDNLNLRYQDKDEGRSSVRCVFAF